MTPTLVGRWQTRIAMLGTLGLLVTAIFAMAYASPIFFWVLLWVLVFGLVWDVVFILIQALRWDRDWPAAFQIGSAIVEGAFVYGVASVWGLPGVPQGLVPLGIFVAHYGTVWLVTFIWVQGPMRALFPFWRFHGGRIVPAVVPSPALRAGRTGESTASGAAGRPASLAAAALILIVLGLLAAAGGLALTLGAGQLAAAFPAMPELDALATAIGATVLVIGLLEVAAAVGILLGQGWARILGLVLGLFGVAGSLLGLLSPFIGGGGPVDPGSLAVTAVVLLGYLVVVVSLLGAGAYFAARRSATG